MNPADSLRVWLLFRYQSVILAIPNSTTLKVHFINWVRKFDSVVDILDSVAQRGTHTRGHHRGKGAPRAAGAQVSIPFLYIPACSRF